MKPFHIVESFTASGHPKVLPTRLILKYLHCVIVVQTFPHHPQKANSLYKEGKGKV